MSGEQKPRKFRWMIGLGILLIASAVTLGSWNYFAEDLTRQIMWLYFTWPAATFALFLWWTFFSGLRWRTRLIGLAVPLIGIGGFLAVYQFDGFDGAMRPRFSNRWTSDRPDDEYFSSLKDGERSKASVDLMERLQKSSGPSPTGKAPAYARSTPAEFLQTAVSGDSTDPQRWRDVDFLSLSAGSLPRALFRQEPKRWKDSDWPRFRGPRMDGVVRDASIRTDWTPDNPPKNLWQKERKIGKGWSSFAVIDGAVAVTQEQRDEQECVVCYDFSTGTEIWSHGDEAKYSTAMAGEGPRATPTIVGRRVYTLGSTGLLNCLDLADGRSIWQRNILDDAGADMLMWGMAGSPLVHGSLVFVNAGKGNGKSVIAYDRFTGDIVWAAGNESAGYASPSIHRIGGVRQLLIFHGKGLTSFDPNTGDELWSFPWTNGEKINVATPIVRGNRVFLSSGYGAGCALIEVKQRDGEWNVRTVASRPNLFRLKFNDAVYKDGYIYGLDETILKCIRMRDLKIMWRRRGSQLGPGGNYGYGQVLLVNDALVVTGENGFVSFIEADHNVPKYLGGFQALNRRGNGWNQPVVNRGRLLIRNEFEVGCFDLTGK